MNKQELYLIADPLRAMWTESTLVGGQQDCASMPTPIKTSEYNLRMNETNHAIQQFREELDTNLRADFSWLSLAGLFWLEFGDNYFGTDPVNAILLPDPNAPNFAGTFHLNEDGNVQVKMAADAHGTIDEQPISAAHLKPDTADKPTFLHLNDLRFLVVERSDKLAIRLWWRFHPNRLNFKGRKWYSVQDAYRITAEIIAYDPPKKVIIPDMLGNERESEMHAQLLMEKEGQPFRLDAMRLPDGRYYINFKDATAGKTTYPAARFLVTEPPEGTSVIVDFNKAYSPPCAFTPYATCPLPTVNNILTFAIEAGEQYVKIE